MAIAARYHDGVVANVVPVSLEYDAQNTMLIIRDTDKGDVLACWLAGDIHTIPGRRGQLRLGAAGLPDGARVVIDDARNGARVLATLPVLMEKRRQEAGRQIRVVGLATLALASVIIAYLYGIPLLASRVVELVPPAWETRLGETVGRQMEAQLSETGSAPLCDADPDSLSNRALARFAEAVMEGSGSPFELDIKVVRSPVPNAFALPGGQVYFFSGLLEQAETQDEFVGVLAHELGHVVHRHGMEQLISTAGTGLLIGFILGDMTGVSVAAGLGATLIDTRFSREAERQADAFAARMAHRLDFNPAGLAELINRVEADSDLARAFALFNTHPLTDDRKQALEDMSADRPEGLQAPFSNAEWLAIRTMCGPG